MRSAEEPEKKIIILGLGLAKKLPREGGPRNPAIKEQARGDCKELARVRQDV